MTVVGTYMVILFSQILTQLFYFSGLYVENSVENSGWYTVEDNHISMISEDVERVIKIETDYYDDCMWESRIDIAKVYLLNTFYVPTTFNYCYNYYF